MIYIVMQKLKAIIFDKDDTLMQDQVYNPAFGTKYFFEDVIPSCIKLKENGYSLFIISNQSGISKGNFEEKTLLLNYINLNLELNRKYNFNFDGFFYCPHLPEYNCNCRKPSKGLFDRLKSMFGIDSTHSFYLGDRLSDIYFAQNCSIIPVIIHRVDYLYKDKKIYDDFNQIEILEEEGKVLVFNSIIDFVNMIIEFEKKDKRYI